MYEWVSKTTSKKVVKETLQEIKDAGYNIASHDISVGVLYVYVDYDPELSLSKIKIKPKNYKHRNKEYTLTHPFIDYSSRSLKEYFKSQLPDKNFILDINPGAPVYDVVKDIIPVSEITAWERRMIIACQMSPKQLVDEALKIVEKFKLDKWELFICSITLGCGGYIYGK